MRRARRAHLLGLTLASLLLLTSPAAAEIQYVYDGLGRLVGVVDAAGNAAAYEYDAVGNLLGVSRINVADLPGAVGITLVLPSKGKVGTTVRIFGKGLSPTPAHNTVAFNGTPATVLAATAVSLTVTVPTGASTGPIGVTTSSGAATSPSPFQVLVPIGISPGWVNLPVSGTQAFEATEGGTATTNVRWRVNGREGGTAATGTISPTGIYTAPVTVPVPPSVTVTAIHRDDPTLSASSVVTFFGPQPIFLAGGAAAGVTVQIAAPPIVDRTARAALSVGVASTAVDRSVFGRLSIGGLPSTAVDRNVWSSLTVAVQPVITAVTPASGAPGAPVTLTLAGSGLPGATAVTFLRNGAADSTLTSSDLVVNPEGTQVTLTLSIGAAAVVGDRVVRITTPTGTSSPLGTGGNRFTVQ